MASVECLEKLELTKEISTGLESRCTEVDLNTGIGISKFITDNCENIALVIRLLLLKLKLDTVVNISKFVTDNCAHIALVIKLLQSASTNCRKCGFPNKKGDGCLYCDLGFYNSEF